MEFSFNLSTRSGSVLATLTEVTFVTGGGGCFFIVPSYFFVHKPGAVHVHEKSAEIATYLLH